MSSHVTPGPYTPFNPAEVRPFPNGITSPSIRDAINRAVAELHGDRVVYMAYAKGEGGETRAGVSVFVDLGHGLSWSGEVNHDWNGAHAEGFGFQTMIVGRL